MGARDRTRRGPSAAPHGAPGRRAGNGRLTRLSVVVPATDAPPALGRCLAALAGADEIAVVEDPGLGPAAARNAGAARTDGDVLVFVDSDVVIRPDALRRIREAFDRDAGLAAVFGAYDDEPEAEGVVSGFRNLLHHHVHSRAGGDAETFWAGLGAVRREAFDGVDGFDERYRTASIEDVELGMRLRAAGHRIRLDPSIRGTHLKRWTLAGMLRTDFARRGLPWVGLLLDRRQAPRTLNLGWRHRLSALASLAGALAVLGRRPAGAAGAVAALVALNRSLYALVARRRGPAAGVASVGLHALHHLAGAAAVPAGVFLRLVGRLRTR